MTVLEVLRSVVAANGSQKEAARVLCISPQYLCDILHGRREVSADVAEMLGFRRVVTYEPLSSVTESGTTHHAVATPSRDTRASVVAPRDSLLIPLPQEPE